MIDRAEIGELRVYNTEAAVAAQRCEVLVVGLLILGDKSAYVVHLIAALRVVERIVRVRDVNVDEVGEEQP